MSMRKNSLKGLIFVLILLVGIGVYFFIKISKENFTISVRVTDNTKFISNAKVNIDGKLYPTDEKGMTSISMKVKENDKILVTTSADRYKEKVDTIVVDKERQKTEHTNLIVQLTKK
jgi:hypothetical protein